MLTSLTKRWGAGAPRRVDDSLWWIICVVPDAVVLTETLFKPSAQDSRHRCTGHESLSAVCLELFYFWPCTYTKCWFVISGLLHLKKMQTTPPTTARGQRDASETLEATIRSSKSVKNVAVNISPTPTFFAYLFKT